MTQDDRVVDLPDAGVPADQGLSSLGLIMQLAGNVFAAFATMIAIDIILAAGSVRGGSSELVWVFLVVGVSVARSMFHRAAGSQLLYGSQQDPSGGRIAGIRRYITFALIHTAFVFVMLKLK